MASSTSPKRSGELEGLRHPGGRSLKHFFHETFHSISDDDIFGRSAQLGYYFFFSIFPAFIFLSSLPGVLSGPGSHLRANLMTHLATIVPPDAYNLLQQTFNHTGHNAGRITFGVVIALWSATVGMSAVCDTLNAVHDVKESRPWWKVRLTALGLTLATACLVLCAFAVLFGGDTMIHLAGKSSLQGAVWVVVKIAQWAIAFTVAALIFGVTYYWAPDVKDREWHWITAGAAIGIVLWVLASLALRIYLHYSNAYSNTYGSIGAVMILLLWFYIAGLALLIGAEVNAVIEDTAARQGDPNATEKGQRAPKAA